MPSDTIKFRAMGIDEDLDKRGEPRSLVARDLLETLFAVYGRELKRTELTRGEALLLCDATKSTFFTPGLAGQEVRLDAEEAIKGPERLAEKWDIDGDALIAKMANWTPGQQAAIADAIKRWRTLENHEDYDTSLKEVGLIRK